MANEKFPVEKSDTEWRELLSADQFRVLREHGTERAGTSPLNFEKRTGVYHCAACGQPLFESSTKYESGSGWPSFCQPLPNAVATTTDTHAWHDARGSSLQELRRPSRPRVRRRPAAHRSALLHERAFAEVRTEVNQGGRAASGEPAALSHLRRKPGRTDMRAVSPLPLRFVSLAASASGLAFTSTALTSLLSREQ